MRESQHPKSTQRCFYYFKYEMKIEFIPHIQEEIQQFLNLCQDKVMVSEFIPSISSAIHRRIKDIDRFFKKNWNDYRIQQILRSRKLLVDFTKKYHQYLSTEKELQLKPEKTLLDAHLQAKTLSKSNSKGKQYSSDMKKYTQSSVKKGLNNSLEEKSPPRKILKTPQPSKVVQKSSSGKANLYDSKEKVMLSSTQKDHKKVKVKSTKIMPKISPTTKKMTKEEYITYLKNKKGNT